MLRPPRVSHGDGRLLWILLLGVAADHCLCNPDRFLCVVVLGFLFDYGLRYHLCLTVTVAVDSRELSEDDCQETPNANSDHNIATIRLSSRGISLHNTANEEISLFDSSHSSAFSSVHTAESGADERAFPKSKIGSKRSSEEKATHGADGNEQVTAATRAREDGVDLDEESNDRLDDTRVEAAHDTQPSTADDPAAVGANTNSGKAADILSAAEHTGSILNAKQGHSNPEIPTENSKTATLEHKSENSFQDSGEAEAQLSQAQDPTTATTKQCKKISAWASALIESDRKTRLDSAKNLRRLLEGVNPPIQEAIDAGVMPTLVKLLNDSCVEMQNESAWILSNIAAGSSSQTNAVVGSAAIPGLVRLLSSPSSEARLSALWALANIAADGPSNRDEVLKAGAMPPTVILLQQPQPERNFLRCASWAVRYFCTGSRRPDFELVQIALPVLAELTKSLDEGVQHDAASAIAHFSGGTDVEQRSVIETGAAGRLVELLSHASPDVQQLSLRAIEKLVVVWASKQPDAMDSLLPMLTKLLASPSASIRCDACRALANIAGQKKALQPLTAAKITPPLIRTLGDDSYSVRKQAALAIVKATNTPHVGQLMCLVSSGSSAGLKKITSLLSTCPDVVETESNEKEEPKI